MSQSTSQLIDRSIINEIHSRFNSFDEFLTRLSPFLKDCSNLSEVGFVIRSEQFTYLDLLKSLCAIIKHDIEVLESHITFVDE